MYIGLTLVTFCTVLEFYGHVDILQYFASGSHSTEHALLSSIRQTVLLYLDFSSENTRFRLNLVFKADTKICWTN